jgi:2-polyprenyl-3-methyl-5-hydroxy-6-metoxy-1,4-benzoquinol methylase
MKGCITMLSTEKNLGRLNFRTCCVCGSASLESVFTQATNSITGIGDIQYQHKINLCQDCGFVLASPLLPEEYILRYYENFSNYELQHSAGEHSADAQAMVDRQVQMLTSRFEDGFKGKALDIGCSMAYALYLLKKQGWEVMGMDPSDWCIRESKKKYDVDVKKGFICEDLSAVMGPVDAIILSHVLEHLVDPVQALIHIRSAMSVGGVLYIEVPNLMDHTHLPGYFAFEHVNYFTPVSLTNLAHRAGFEVETLDQFDNANYKSSYPVIGATLRKTDKTFSLVSDVTVARAVMDDYVRHVPDILARLNHRIAHAVQSTPPGRLALWGAGIHTSQILSDTQLSNVPLCCIFDNDSKKAGHTLGAIPIKAFPQDPADAKVEVDAILISSLASEDEIFEQLRPLQSHGIKIFRLYGTQ